MNRENDFFAVFVLSFSQCELSNYNMMDLTLPTFPSDNRLV